MADPLHSMLAACKRVIRHSLKQGKAYLKGHAFHYARQQDAGGAGLYGHLWAEFKTPIPDRGSPQIRADRLWNLQLAQQQIDGLLLPPGTIFSFSQRVGEPSLRRGYRAGPVFTQGKVAAGAGGGLCLLATNLFNTFLWSGCEVLERHCHSIDAYGEQRFYPLGRDAAVAYGYKDLVVRNSTGFPLQLRLAVLSTTGEVASSLWGQQACSFQVAIESRVLQEIPPFTDDQLPGWRAEMVRMVRELKAPEDPWEVSYHGISDYAPCERS
jgi:vancomycin resistance protein VanW